MLRCVSASEIAARALAASCPSAISTGAVSVPNTGGFQTFTTVSVNGISLSAGQHVLRVVLDTAASGSTSVGNFNWFSFSGGGG